MWRRQETEEEVKQITGDRFDLFDYPEFVKMNYCHKILPLSDYTDKWYQKYHNLCIYGPFITYCSIYVVQMYGSLLHYSGSSL